MKHDTFVFFSFIPIAKVFAPHSLNRWFNFRRFHLQIILSILHKSHHVRIWHDGRCACVCARAHSTDSDRLDKGFRSAIGWLPFHSHRFYYVHCPSYPNICRTRVCALRFALVSRLLRRVCLLLLVFGAVTPLPQHIFINFDWSQITNE